MRSNLLTCIFLVSVVMLSCDNKRVFDEYKSVPNQWHKDSVITFNLQVPDSTKAYDLFVNLRNTNAYKYNNLYLIVDMKFPHGKTIKDTLEYRMASPNGELLGTGITGVKENKLWYKKAVIFNENGNYQIKIKHAMRENGKVNGVVNLEGVTDIGFRIENPEEN